MVVVDEFGPALTIGDEVCGIIRRNMRALEIDAIHPADYDVVSQGHFGGGFDELISVLRGG